MTRGTFDLVVCENVIDGRTGQTVLNHSRLVEDTP